MNDDVNGASVVREVMISISAVHTEFNKSFLVPISFSDLLVNSAIKSTLTIHCQ